MEDKQEFYDSLVYKYEGDHKKALFEFCYKYNIFFNAELINDMLLKKDCEEIQNLPESYIIKIQLDENFSGMTFFSQIKLENFEKIYSEDLIKLSLTEEDRKCRQMVVDILGTDPFAEDDPLDRPQLYRDAATILNDSMRKDLTKSRAALSIIRGYQNINKYQQKINEITKLETIDEDAQKQLDQYIKIQKTMQDSINQTAEKNNFTVKGIGSNGKGMLSDVMNQIEQKGIDEGITNFYDIETSRSIEEVANISFKAQLNQVSLSKTDYADIMSEQCILVRKAQRQAKDALEALRLAKEKITKQQLLQELELDYRKKGISEEEIEEFVGREYNLFDGKERL